VLGELQLAMHEMRSRVGADGDEHALQIERALHPVAHVDDAHPGDVVDPVDALHAGVQVQLDLRVGGGALLHRLGCAQCSPAVDQVHPVGEPTQEGGLLQGGVAAADHGDGLAAEEEAVAGGTPGHTAPAQPALSHEVVGDQENGLTGRDWGWPSMKTSTFSS